LQLANFWQDVTVDLEKNRVYIPLALLRGHGCLLDDLFARRMSAAFANAMREAVDRTRELFNEGLPLARMVDRRLAVDIELFSRGGMRVLDKIERRKYDVLSRRPAISATERVALLFGTLARAAFTRAA
jgi:phytoene/squalene synthetase